MKEWMEERREKRGTGKNGEERVRERDVEETVLKME